MMLMLCSVYDDDDDDDSEWPPVQSTVFYNFHFKVFKFPQSNWHYCYYFVLLNRLSFGCGSIESWNIYEYVQALACCSRLGSLETARKEICVFQRELLVQLELLESSLFAFVHPGRNSFHEAWLKKWLDVMS